MIVLELNMRFRCIKLLFRRKIMLSYKDVVSFIISLLLITSVMLLNNHSFTLPAYSATTCSNLPISAATANGAESTNPVSNAVDNNLATRWSNLGLGSWIRLDLGSQKTVCSVDISWYNGNQRVNTFNIAVSNDGTAFTTVFSGKSSGTTTAAEKYDFTDTQARYVKITVTGNTQSDWVSISEIRVFGDVITPPSSNCDINLPISAITASGNDGNVPSNVLDNNLNTRWANLGIGSWIRADLGSTQNICSVDIAWYVGNTRQSNFVIATSTDGTTFSNVLTTTSSGTTLNSEKYTIPSTNARYVRVTVNGNTANAWASITELDIFRSKSSSNSPPTANSQSVSVNKDTPKAITLAASDPNGDTLTYTKLTNPVHGTLTGTAPSLTYTPSTGYTGSDSFTFKANDGKVDSNVATISITISSSSPAGTDKFGIKKLYATKSAGEEWFLNMANPTSDARFNPQNTITKNSDGSWKMKSSKVRMGVYTSSGYSSSKIPTLDHSKIASKGYMLAPNDWKNIEMTMYAKVNVAGSDDNFAPYGRGGRHTGGGYPDGCEGSAYKGDLFFSGKVRFAKEQWHVSYVFTNYETGTTSIKGKWVGFKFVVYNFQLSGKTVVKTELWLDKNNDGNFVKVDENVDKGGWGNTGRECNGAPDQIITWGGPIATFRWDTATDVDFKNLSVREIQPPQ